MPVALPSGLVVEENTPLAPFTSWLVGGPAEFLAQPKSELELREALAWASLTGVPVTILAGGTNVLISDRGIKGLTILLRKLSGLTSEDAEGRLKIECLAGTSKSELLKLFLKRKLEPALFLAGLPGDVGGGIVMNAGVSESMRPREFVELTDWIEVLRPPAPAAQPSARDERVSAHEVSRVAQSLALERIPAEKLKWSYRHCEGWRPGVVARAGLSWELAPKDDILARVRAANLTRLSKQPLDMPSCGSVFVNPPGTASGRLIDQAGLKGFTIGGAKVSEKHANFIVNTGRATASEIEQVILHVRRCVFDKHGIELRTEVVFLGEWNG